MPSYTEQDTERVRQLEGSSAGMDTQRLTSVSSHSTPTQVAPQVPANKGTNVLALALIIAGVVGLLIQFLAGNLLLVPGFILLTIGSCFLFFAFWQRIYGLLIPGSILAGLSLGITFAEVTSGVSVLWGLALGFLSILYVGRAWFQVNSPWPMFPAIPLFGAGLIVAIANLPSIFFGGLMWLPLLLIGAGLYLGWQRRPA
ncbi:MAG: hypothetical protein GFH27_549283n256 [Chloroflexi bacterium AL-W]|nr:hypothetical protein [Chloroflexi bacterium AL-N1]NOK64624.1 hypothetical protein [Chloroflexi bacterium AL-N10]NOK75865.1 hypothetical protein [Chloroflexi bacterium AL-N5]NOK80377.1 hypothetical protein [Chloroflexi bacterium AL-W]NOK86890.1 hypothetical protein [Chloroflexi bacterium AL-N15]